MHKYTSAILLLVLLSLFLPSSSFSQELKPQYTVGTNLLGYANFVTLNAEASVSFSRKWSLNIQGKYNPITYNKGKANQMQSRQATIALGTRYWPWYVNSGWFFGTSAQYTNYNRGGITKPETVEGDAYGLNLNAGYALMIGKHWNIEFGLGVIGGYTNYIKYSCPQCGRTIDKGKKAFIMPNNLLVQVVYLF